MFPEKAEQSVPPLPMRATSLSVTPTGSDNSGPFLGQPIRGFDLGSTTYDKPVNANRSSVPLRRSFETQAFLAMFLGWPALVIAGQILLQVWAWSFFAVVQSRGFIALPYSSAYWAKANPHLVTLLSTLISTLLAACSSFLFSFGVRRSIALYLREPMSLAAFVSTVSISARSLVLAPRKWKWSAMSIGVMILTGIQTSAWSTFLTPGAIVIETPVSGSELDLSSPLLRQMHTSSPAIFRSCILDGSLRPAFIVGGTESGYALAKHHMGSPALFTLMDQTFNVSTAGILPATLRDVNASAWFPSMTVIPSTLQGVDGIPHGLSSNYTMRQQGFSADVTCEFKNLSAATTPTLAYRTDTVKDWNELNFTGSLAVRYSEITSTCLVPDGLGVNRTWAYTTESNYILMIACGPADNYTVIFASSGLYKTRTTVCSVSPKVTQVDVGYSDSQSSSGTIDVTATLDGAVRDPDGVAGLSTVTAMSNIVFLAQSTATNVMGDEINSLLTDVRDENVNEATLALMENYIRGIAEYSGSIMRACLSGKNGTFVDGAPANMTVPTSGTIFIQTVGWTHLGASSIWVLIPGALVALATIIVVVVAVVQHASDPPSDPFDPSDPMHLVAVAAAGGLSDAFRGTSEKDIQTAERMTVVLRSVPGRGPALVRADYISAPFGVQVQPGALSLSQNDR
ncbi:hypothetical protein FB451DRAFT_362125 [Mycena latifolia]|nr:hypothetical protein FB451DRAFT_362125 [Mycena latifolia]